MKNETALGHVLTLMTIIIWGTTFVSTKVLLEAFTPIEILFFRFTLGYLSLWAIYPRKGTYGTLRQELLFAAAGLCGVTLYFLLENIALTYTFASNVGVIISIAPFFTAFLANWLLDGEPLRKRFFVGFAAALTGIILIGLNGNFVLKLNPVGDILATLAAVVWACYSILMKKIGAFRMNMVFCTRKVFFYGLLFMLPALFIFDCRLGLERFASPVNTLNLLYLGFGASRPLLRYVELGGQDSRRSQDHRVHLPRPCGDGRVFGDHPSRDDHAPRHCRNGPHPYRADRFTTIEDVEERGSFSWKNGPSFT